MKPLALDLCCGKGGWTIGLLNAGWDVIGMDIQLWDGYPGQFKLCDVRNVVGDTKFWLRGKKVSLVVASPPCQQFSISSQPFKRSRERFTKDNPPDRSIWDACVKIARELDAPLILENVRGAVKWMGKETWHYGSYYFWGEMPALQPIPYMRSNGIMSNRKGFKRALPTSGNQPTGGFKCLPLDGKVYLGNAQAKNLKRDSFHCDQRKSIFVGECNWIDGVRKGLSRKEWAARIAMIPEELSTWIGECFYPKNAIPEAQPIQRG